jgi:hypothetical protein
LIKDSSSCSTDIPQPRRPKAHSRSYTALAHTMIKPFDTRRARDPFKTSRLPVFPTACLAERAPLGVCFSTLESLVVEEALCCPRAHDPSLPDLWRLMVGCGSCMHEPWPIVKHGSWMVMWYANSTKLTNSWASTGLAGDLERLIAVWKAPISGSRWHLLTAW